jgi:hypothetical protein
MGKPKAYEDDPNVENADFGCPRRHRVEYQRTRANQGDSCYGTPRSPVLSHKPRAATITREP